MIGEYDKWPDCYLSGYNHVDDLPYIWMVYFFGTHAKETGIGLAWQKKIRSGWISYYHECI